MKIERCWHSPLRFLLAPPALFFGLISASRRSLYRAGLLRQTRMPVPVIVVGNITAGGAGKTPLVAALARALREAGMHPGIVSRGYGGNAPGPEAVHPKSDPARSGDEPVLLAARGFPVWIGRKRVEAALALLSAEPECDILIADDGLQHYALARDFEIAVIDGSKGLGNGWLLPAGPLREPPSRLDSVDAVVINSPSGARIPDTPGVPRFDMFLGGTTFLNVDTLEAASPTRFEGLRVHAVAGIGNPERFFDRLASLGIGFVPHPFPDHHPYRASDLDFENRDAVLMTEKDAVKCKGLAPGKCWFLPVEAEIDPRLLALLLKTLGK